MVLDPRHRDRLVGVGEILDRLAGSGSRVTVGASHLLHALAARSCTSCRRWSGACGRPRPGRRARSSGMARRIPPTSRDRAAMRRHPCTSSRSRLVEQEDAAQHQLGDALGVCLGISQRRVEPQLPPNTCHLSTSHISRSLSMSATRSQVVLCSRLGIRRRAAAAALVEQQDLYFSGSNCRRWSGLSRRRGRRGGTPPACRPDCRTAPSKAMPVADVEHARVVGLDLRIERAAACMGMSIRS